VDPGLRVEERGTPLTGGDLEGYDIALDRGGAGGEGGERERVVDRAVEVDDERTVLVRHAEVEGPPRGGGLPVRRVVEVQLEPGRRASGGEQAALALLRLEGHDPGRLRLQLQILLGGLGREGLERIEPCESAEEDDA